MASAEAERADVDCGWSAETQQLKALVVQYHGKLLPKDGHDRLFWPTAAKLRALKDQHQVVRLLRQAPTDHEGLLHHEPKGLNILCGYLSHRSPTSLQYCRMTYHILDLLSTAKIPRDVVRKTSLLSVLRQYLLPDWETQPGVIFLARKLDEVYSAPLQLTGIKRYYL